MNDAVLARLFRRFQERNDGRALSLVFDATARELLQVAFHLHRDAAEAEDLVQNTFVTAIAKAKEYDGRAPLKGWLYGILWREAMKARRSAAQRARPAVEPPGLASDPLDELAARETPEAVERALERLPEDVRLVLEPHLCEGERAEEIAARLERSPGTVRSQIHRGLERLRRILPGGLASYPALVPVRGIDQVRDHVLRTAGITPTAVAGAGLVLLEAQVAAALPAVAAAGLLAALAFAAVRAYERPEHATGGHSGSSAPVVDQREERGGRPDERIDRAARASDERVAVETRTPPEPSAGSPTSAPATDDVAYWRARYAEAPEDWRHGYAITRELSWLPAADSTRILSALWPELSVAVREQAMKPFVFAGGRENALHVLHLGATDPADSVQERAFLYLEGYAFRSFVRDPSAYAGWAAQFVGLPVADVLAANAVRFVDELRNADETTRVERMTDLRHLQLRAGDGVELDLGRILREAGLLDVLAHSIASPSPTTRALALGWSKVLGADEAWARRHVLPIVAARDPESIHPAIAALERADCGFAAPMLLDYLRDAANASAPAPGEDFTDARFLATSRAARALAEFADPAAIPVLIEIVLHDRSGRLAYDIGYFALSKLTGVDHDESHDAAFWLAWWDENAARFPDHVRTIPIRR